MSEAMARTRRTARRACRRKYSLTNAICQMCCYVPAGERHHIDGDVTNNAPDNILLACLSCHDAIHTGDRWNADRAADRWSNGHAIRSAQ